MYLEHGVTIYHADALSVHCLLYTSDAADDMQCVDLGGRRIIKKKFFQAEDGIRDFCLSRGLGDVYKRQSVRMAIMKTGPKPEAVLCRKLWEVLRRIRKHF